MNQTPGFIVNNSMKRFNESLLLIFHYYVYSFLIAHIVHEISSKNIYYEVLYTLQTRAEVLHAIFSLSHRTPLKRKARAFVVYIEMAGNI